MGERRTNEVEQRLTDLSRRADQSGDLPTAIGALEAREVIKAASNSTGIVFAEGWGICNRNEKGTWVVPGAGKVGPLTELGRKLEDLLSKQNPQ